MTRINDPSDEILATRMGIEVQTDAFDLLVKRHHDRIWGVCCRMVGCSQDAEDLVQETFLRVYRFRDRYDSARPFKAWLDRICVNICLNHLDKRCRRAPMSLGEPTDSAPPEHTAQARRNDPEDRVWTNQLLRQVEGALASLPPVYRAALVLRAFAGLSYLEIARALDCSEGTVMSRINRARVRIRNQMGTPS